MSNSNSEQKKSWLTRLRFAVAAVALAATAIVGGVVADAPDVPEPEEQAAGVSWSYNAGSSSGWWRTNSGVSWS